MRLIELSGHLYSGIMKDCPSGGSVSIVEAVEQRESSVSPEEIRARHVATLTGSGSTQQQGDGADMVECVATLAISVDKLARMVRDMSSSHVGAEIAQWDTCGLDSQCELNVTSKESTFGVKELTNSLDTETLFGNFQ